jgi:allantoicase
MESLSQQQQGHDENEQQENTMMVKHIASATGVHELNRVQLDEAAPSSVCKNKSVSSSSGNDDENNLVNVLAASRGARVLFATDEWFATAENLLNDTVAPTFDPNAYCTQGKVMDGWESRRRREAGHDWCIIQLATTAEGGAATATTAPAPWSCWSHVDVDTAYFTGNQVPAISIQVAHVSIAEQAQLVQQLPGSVERLLRHGKGILGMGALPQQVQQAKEACDKYGCWTEILPRTPLQPGYEESRHHSIPLPGNNQYAAVPATLVKVNYYPDGGVARLRLWAKQQQEGNSSSPMVLPPVYMPITTGRRCSVVSHHNDDNDNNHSSHLPSRQPHPQQRHIELSSRQHGGQGVACSNQHYGTPSNLIQETLGRDMGDGWETARHPNRPPILVRNPRTNLTDNNLSDWCIIKLGRIARHGISRVILDTKHFRGNYPESVQVQGALFPDENQNKKYNDDKNKNVEWFDLIARCRMSPDAEHVFDAHLHQLEEEQNNNNNAASPSQPRPVSHIRVTIFPDGGLSRVRVYGQCDDDCNRDGSSSATTPAVASHL